MPLLINSLGERTHKHTHTDVRTETIQRNQVGTGHRLAPGLATASCVNIYQYESLLIQVTFGNTKHFNANYRTLIYDTHSPWLIVASYAVKSYSSVIVGMIVRYLLLLNR